MERMINMGVKDIYNRVVVAPRYMTERETDELRRTYNYHANYKVVGQVASVPNWLVVEDTTPVEIKKLPSKKEMLETILNSGLVAHWGYFEIEKLKKSTKADLAKHYANAR